MSLKQKVLEIVAGGLTLASLSGVPAYASFTIPQSTFDKSTIVYRDVDGDGLTDMILGNKSGVIYLKGRGNSAYVNKQRICNLKGEEKPTITFIDLKEGLELIIMTRSEFKFYLFKEGKFIEHEPELQWMEED